VQLKALYKDAAQIRMAGGMQGYQQLAAGKAMMSAGEGMAKGGGDGGGGSPMLAGAGLGMGMAMANMFQQNTGHQAAPPAAAPSAPVAAAPAQASGPTLEERLKKLKALKDAGLLDDAEYAAKRGEILKDL